MLSCVKVNTMLSAQTLPQYVVTCMIMSHHGDTMRDDVTQQAIPLESDVHLCFDNKMITIQTEIINISGTVLQYQISVHIQSWGKSGA